MKRPWVILYIYTRAVFTPKRDSIAKEMSFSPRLADAGFEKKKRWYRQTKALNFCALVLGLIVHLLSITTCGYFLSSLVAYDNLLGHIGEVRGNRTIGAPIDYYYDDDDGEKVLVNIQEYVDDREAVVDDALILPGFSKKELTSYFTSLRNSAMVMTALTAVTTLTTFVTLGFLWLAIWSKLLR